MTMIRSALVSRSLSLSSSRRLLSSQAVALAESTSTKTGAPSSAYSIPTGSASIGQAGVVIRDVGCTRRIFLMDPHLSADEIEGLAFRIKMLTKNLALNSVFIATSNDDDTATGALPSSAVEMGRFGQDVDEDHFHPDDSVFHVAGGYDALQIAMSGKYKDDASMQQLLDGLADLALATRGNARETLIPVITLPHGLVNDGGYALCMGGFVLATPDTCFKVTNPSKGLSLDPIGLSFILPRLGWEFQQPSAEYTGCGLILALTGMEANASDMMETGLATHYMDNASTVSMMERALSELPPWDQQNLLRKHPRFYGHPARQDDVNSQYRNVAVANLVHSFCQYNIEGKDVFTNRESDFRVDDDPSVDLDYTNIHVDRQSDLVNYAATFDVVFREEQTVLGIMERLHEISERESLDQEEMEGIAVAKDLYERMQRQSPLALSVVYSLMQLGAKKGESLESCMEREKRAQLKMFQLEDFDNWAHQHAPSAQEEDIFTGWKHKALADVSQEQVDEIIGS